MIDLSARPSAEIEVEVAPGVTLVLANLPLAVIAADLAWSRAVSQINEMTSLPERAVIEAKALVARAEAILQAGLRRWSGVTEEGKQVTPSAARIRALCEHPGVITKLLSAVADWQAVWSTEAGKSPTPSAGT